MIQVSILFTFLISFSHSLLLADPAVAQTHQTHQHSFAGAEQWAQEFDDPKRDTWQMPHQVIQALALKPNAVIADIGSGTGYFSVRLAHMVPKGRIYGVDIEPDMVKYLAERAKRDGLNNLVSLAGLPGDPLLPEKVDLILMVDVFHHLDDRDSYLRKLQDVLKPSGRIAIIDFRMDSPEGPPMNARSTPDGIKAELNRSGYVLVQEYTFLPNQYFLVFEQLRK